jgi:hypothetical protein
VVLRTVAAYSDAALAYRCGGSTPWLYDEERRVSRLTATEDSGASTKTQPLYFQHQQLDVADVMRRLRSAQRGLFKPVR